jgi:hypothetical protein
VVGSCSRSFGSTYLRRTAHVPEAGKERERERKREKSRERERE